jgi:hypothetical protein
LVAIAFLVVAGLTSSISAKLFGFKTQDGKGWITCDDEETNCSDSNHLNDSNAVCVRRIVKAVSDASNKGYIDALNEDSFLGSDYTNKLVSRCMN